MLVGGFDPPSEEARLDAIGIIKASEDDDSIRYLLQHQRQAIPLGFIRTLHPNPGLFSPIRKPRHCDWLANYEERGQTYKQFLENPNPVPLKKHNTIYLQSLSFAEEALSNDILQPLSHFASIFFGLSVKVLPPKDYSRKIAIRNFNGSYQVDASQLVNKLRSKVPNDGLCLTVLTLCDVYAGGYGGEFVFGLADHAKRVGVFSLARYLPNFKDLPISQIDPNLQTYSDVLLKGIKVVCHEVARVFGIHHCIYYNCLMNGINNAMELDNTPLFLCPVCLRKLYKSVRFDILRRYRRMRQFCAEQKLSKEHDWLNLRLRYLEPR